MNLIERSRALVPARISALIPALAPVLLLLALLEPQSIAAPVGAAVQDAATNGVNNGVENEQNVTLNITLLGDSYSAGNGAGDYEREDLDDSGERRTAAAIIGRTTTWTGSMRAVRTRP